MAADTKPKPTDSELICSALSDEDMAAVLAATIAQAILSASALGRVECKRFVISAAVALVRDIRAGERAKLANQIKGQAVAKGLVS